MSNDNPYIDINTATRNQLFAFARTELGLEVKVDMSKQDLQQLVGAQIGQKTSLGESPEPKGLVEKNLRNLRGQKKVTIRIADDPSYPHRVPVSVNGVDFTMKRGAWVEVPEAVVEVLQNAVQTIISQQEVDGKIITTQQHKHAFQFEIRHKAA